MSSGNISRRPRSIANDKTILEKAVYPAKLPAGPTTPKPGPTLLKQAETAVKLLSKPKGSKHIKTKNENFCTSDVSGTEEKQGYITIDAIRDEMPN